MEALWVCWEARTPWGSRLGPGFHQLEHFWPSSHLPGRATGATPGQCQDSPQPVQMDPVSPVSAGTPVPWLLPLSPAPWLCLQVTPGLQQGVEMRPCYLQRRWA